MAKIGKKKGWKTVLVVLLSALTVAGGVAAATALIQPSETKEVGRLSWKVGGLVEANGVEDEDCKTSIVMTKAVGARGLHVEVSEAAGFTGTYSVCYYTANGAKIDFAQDEKGSTKFSTSEDFANAYAVYAKIVYTPELAEGKERLYFWDVYNYTDDITVVYNRVQDNVLKTTNLQMKNNGAGIYSITGYNGSLYAINSFGEMIVSSDDGKNWNSFDFQPFEDYDATCNVEDLSVIDGKMYVPCSYWNISGKRPPSLSYDFGSKKWETVFDVAYSNAFKNVNGIIFALCKNGTALRAFDEESNTWQTLNVGLESSYFSIRDICYVNGKYIAVGDYSLSTGSSCINVLIADNPFESWSSSLSSEDLGNFRRIMHDGTHYILSGGDKDGAPVIYIGDDMANLHKAEINTNIALGKVRDIESFNGKLFATVFSSTEAKGEVLMSEDNGATWKVIVDGVDDLWTLYNAGNKLFIGGTNAIYYFEK